VHEGLVRRGFVLILRALQYFPEACLALLAESMTPNDGWKSQATIAVPGGWRLSSQRKPLFRCSEAAGQARFSATVVLLYQGYFVYPSPDPTEYFAVADFCLQLLDLVKKDLMDSSNLLCPVSFHHSIALSFVQSYP
jgi:hypothetical protein